MAPMKDGFILLTTLLHHVLYVYNPPNVQETHGCFNKSLEECKWVRFNQSYLYNDELACVSLFNTSDVLQQDDPFVLRYKLRFTFMDGSSGETKWIEQPMTSKEFSMAATKAIMFMSSGFILANFLFALVYCLFTCKLRIKDMNFEMYSMFKK